MCVFGGGGGLVNGYNDERIFYARRMFEQIKATGADMIVVPCHSCHGQLFAVKNDIDMDYLEINYLWELVADCLILP